MKQYLSTTVIEKKTNLLDIQPDTLKTEAKEYARHATKRSICRSRRYQNTLFV